MSSVPLAPFKTTNKKGAGRSRTAYFRGLPFGFPGRSPQNKGNLKRRQATGAEVFRGILFRLVSTSRGSEDRLWHIRCMARHNYDSLWFRMRCASTHENGCCRMRWRTVSFPSFHVRQTNKYQTIFTLKPMKRLRLHTFVELAKPWLHRPVSRLDSTRAVKPQGLNGKLPFVGLGKPGVQLCSATPLVEGARQ